MEWRVVVCLPLFIIFFGIITTVTGCSSPVATTKTYSSRQSAVIASVPFIAQISITCDGTPMPPSPLYARVGTRTLPAIRIPGNKYQVSWIEEFSEAVSGDREIHLYTEAGYTALRKAIRSDQDISSIPSLTTVTLSHSTGYTGPWINSEIVAALLSMFIVYIAIINKNALLS